MTTENTFSMPLAKYLKTETNTVHDALDQRVMAAKPFLTAENYKGFLKMQYAFHRLVSPLFLRTSLQVYFPELPSGCRFNQVLDDCFDLGLKPNVLDQEYQQLTLPDISDDQAIGWLYTIEGSNIGGGFLYKMAEAVGFNDNYGARHLGGHIQGRSQHWRAFKKYLNTAPLTTEQRYAAKQGAQQAFQFVRERVEDYLPKCD